MTRFLPPFLEPSVVGVHTCSNRLAKCRRLLWTSCKLSSEWYFYVHSICLHRGRHRSGRETWRERECDAGHDISNLNWMASGHILDIFVESMLFGMFTCCMAIDQWDQACCRYAIRCTRRMILWGSVDLVHVLARRKRKLRPRLAEGMLVAWQRLIKMTC